MQSIRVLVVDGSSRARQTVSRALTGDPDLDVVGSAATPESALAKFAALHPDVIVLEVELAEGSGLKALVALREANASVPIVMLSRLTARGSEAAVESLMHGANGYITKPEKEADLERCVTVELIPKIKSICAAISKPFAPSEQRVVQPIVAVEAQRPTSSPSIDHALQHRPSEPAQIVAIATSTGGPAALAMVLSGLPTSFQVPIVIVQHMPEGFTRALAESLSRQSSRLVREVDSNQPLTAAPIWLAAGGRDLVVFRESFRVQVRSQIGPPENDCCPSADVLFRSVSEVFGSHALAVVLTGIGNDGLAGCRDIRAAGGAVIAQDQASSIAWGMPGQVTSAGLADVVVPLAQVAREIVLRTSVVSSSHRINRGDT